MICVVSMPVRYGMMSLRTRIAITTSSSAVLPARSPRPLIVHSICRAPASTAASAFAVAMPRSLWQWVAKITASGARHPLDQLADDRRALARRGVADGVGDVDRGRPGPDRDLDDPAQVVVLGAGRVHRRPLHVVAEVAGVGHRVVDPLGHLAPCRAASGIAVQRRGADEGVDARALRVPHRLPAAVDVGDGWRGPGRRSPRSAPAGRSRLTASKSPSEAIGKPASMMSTPISSRSFAICSFSLEGHGGAGRLLAVAQGGVEDQDAVLGGCGVGHGSVPGLGGSAARRALL